MRRIGDGGIPARELVDELIRRLGVAEACRQVGVPSQHALREFAELCDLLAEIDRL